MKTKQERLEYINSTCNTNYKSMEEVDWYNISKNYDLSEDFIRKFQDKVAWYYISEEQVLSEELIREFQDKVNWYNISWYQKLSEDFIREFKDKVDWDCISRYQILSEDFIKEFADNVVWTKISSYQILSEDFIREFADKVDWGKISMYQTLSENFIREFAKKNKLKINTGYNGSFCLDKPKETECLPESNTEFNININRPKKIILTEPTEPFKEEDPLQLKTRNIEIYENELLNVLKNPQLPTLITNIQDLELLLQKIDKQINENNFYHIEVKWTGDGITDGESNNDIFDLETGIFTEKELKEYMQYLHSFYEIKLNKLKYQYLNIFNGVKYRNLITE